MMDIAREAMRKSHRRFETLLKGKGKVTIDLVTEFNNMTARILLMCALGEDITEQLVWYYSGGMKEKMMLADAMRLTFSNLINRMMWPKLILFPFLAKYFIFKEESEYWQNA
jgi:hypothetical protein